QIPSRENAYLMEAHAGAVRGIAFPNFLDAYEPHQASPNLLVFSRQLRAFRLFIQDDRLKAETNSQIVMALGRCVSIVAYAQLIAENASILAVPSQVVAAIFHS